MDVCITRDCQIDDVFHHQGEELSIEEHQFNPDCMEKKEPLPDEKEPHDEIHDDPPPDNKTLKKGKK